MNLKDAKDLCKELRGPKFGVTLWKALDIMWRHLN